MTEGYELAFLIGGLILSLSAFSLIFGDNYLFRLAASILSGAISAYICVLLVESYFYPLILEIINERTQLSTLQIVRAVIITVGILLLFCKAYTASKTGGKIVMTIIMCACAVVLVMGAVGGTIPAFLRSLAGQFRLTSLSAENKSDVWYWVKAGTILLSAISTLLFTRHYKLPGKNKSAEKENSESVVGNIVVGFTFGAIAAAVFLTAANLFVNHISGLISSIQSLVK
ncbi:MAG: hypothetical protein IJI41_08925 [Anaerolineaceae bacterium]|nr:hypothetical protein [Anaerolineaceae bacterium]